MSLKNNLVSLLNSVGNTEVLKNDAYSYKVLFSNNVLPDPSNARYFPARVISDHHAELFVKRRISKKQLIELYEGEGTVLIGHSCCINCIKRDSKVWREVNTNIESIIELSINIKMSETIQVPTIYPIDDNKFKILTGHRRFFAMIYAYGGEAPIEFKVYNHAPALKKTKQFQENACREDLSQYGKLVAFISALEELEALSDASKVSGQKKITVRDKVAILGISMGAFDNYNVLTRYNSVINAYKSGMSKPFSVVKKIVLNIEQEYKQRFDKNILTIRDKNAINSDIERTLKGEEKQQRPRAFNIKNVTSGQTIKTLLESNIMDSSVDVNWDEIDWEDNKQINGALNKVIEFIQAELSN